MILSEIKDQIKITQQNVKSHPKCLKSITQFSSVKVIVQSQQNFDIQIEKVREVLPNQNVKHLIQYRFNRKNMKVDTFINMLNCLEVLSENKHFLKMQFYHFSKDSDYILILFEDFGQNMQDLISRSNFSIGEKHAKTSFRDIAKSLFLVDSVYNGTHNLNLDFILLPMNIYIDIDSDSQRARAKVIPFDFLGQKNELDVNEMPKNIILSPEMLNVLHSQTSEQPLELQMKKSNSYVLGLAYLQLLRGKKVLGQSEREKELGNLPSVQKEGPNDEIIKDNLEKLIVKGKKNGLILILEQCLHYNLGERIGYADLYTMCKNPILFLKHKQIIGQLKSSQRLFAQQTKSYQEAFKNALDEIQSILQESNGDIQFINQQFSTIKQEFESIEVPSFSDGDEISSYQKQFEPNMNDGFSSNNISDKSKGLDIDKKTQVESVLEKDLSISYNTYKQNDEINKTKRIDSSQYDNQRLGTSIIKVRRIKDQDFYNPYGIGTNNHKIIDYAKPKEKQLLNQYQSIVDGEVVGIYSVLAVNDYLIATGGDDSSIRIWNMDDNKKECIQVLIGHSNSIHSLCLLIPSKVIASGSSGENASIKIWNISDGACIKTLKGHTDTISSICKTSNELIVSGSYDSTIKVWRWSTGKCEKTLKQHHFAILTVCVIDENTIASGSDDCTIMIWDIRKGTMLLDIQGHNSWVQNLTYIKKYNQLVSCSGDGTVRLWNRNGQQEYIFSDHNGQVNSVVYIEGKDLLVSVGADQKINIYKLSSRQLKQSVEKAHKDSILNATYLNNSIVTTGIDSMITIWQIAQNQQERDQSSHNNQLNEPQKLIAPLSIDKPNIQSISNNEDSV
ncbi:WD domain, G-beta repeat protein (macronuclear) [Tetrahymena thermophila SB210]|uniref:WD domain, G-beta repeat protein n=1 Tax=Tetrahymena thermophila (strain SB210) TaxID=312017 RepID=Q22EJ0_TETTS|nr:WD domain, G-beta repeat protein [Tetrahymena thermophila SB210]EAR83662.2 WD domain, G-beta repeat protein [Tetrahymena thermophila SB210]|eukprot:XP_001031325.2 WD domain, G-beta repeat protein [Tetrahymena thermophila SB210]